MIIVAMLLFSIGFLYLVKYLKKNNQSHCNNCLKMKVEIDKKLKSIYILKT